MQPPRHRSVGKQGLRKPRNVPGFGDRPSKEVFGAMRPQDVRGNGERRQPASFWNPAAVPLARPMEEGGQPSRSGGHTLGHRSSSHYVWKNPQPAPCVLHPRFRPPDPDPPHAGQARSWGSSTRPAIRCLSSSTVAADSMSTANSKGGSPPGRKALIVSRRLMPSLLRRGNSRTTQKRGGG